MDMEMLPEENHREIGPSCPRGHGEMKPVTNDFGNTEYHQCRSCYLTDEHPLCDACGEEFALERYCSFCLLDLLDDYSEQI
jgi:hypothetical protein